MGSTADPTRGFERALGSWNHFGSWGGDSSGKNVELNRELVGSERTWIVAWIALPFRNEPVIGM